MYLCIYTYIHIYIYTYEDVYICIRMYIYTHMPVVADSNRGTECFLQLLKRQKAKI